jgi:eukaryotic-like serine/threonine-protein kinase
VSLAEGTRIGPYEIAGQIGAGGMGEVYRATDTNLKRAVAIKVLPSAVSGNFDRLARFQREAELLAALNHPNIAAVYGLERTAGVTALVMELVDGPTLADRIAAGPVPLDEALPIARQIAEALEAAHEHGIIHRDLKPANIKVRLDGTVKVLDFGLAKAMESQEGQVPGVSQAPTVTTPALVTGMGVILGTAAYMSPEQAKGQAADRRSDIWSFGCALFEMLTGKRAFGGEDVIDTLAEVRRAEPDWSALPPATPASVHRLLRRCLVKDRKARLADASTLRIEIDEAQGGAHVTTPSTASRFRFERLAWLGAVALLATVAALGVRAAWQSPPAPAEVWFDIEVPARTVGNALAISPNGRQMAFLSGALGDGRVWVHTMDGRGARPIEGTRGAVDRVFWSPDSQSIGFFAGGKLKRVDLSTGTVQTLADTPGSAGATWSREGVILFSPVQGPISRVSQAGGPVTAVTRVDRPEIRHVSPQFLPDGRRFLYFVTGDPRARGVYVGDIDGSQPRRLVIEGLESGPVYTPLGHLLFPRQGALMVQRFDAATLTFGGEARQLVENIRTDVTQGLTHVSVSDIGALVYRRASGEETFRRLVWLDRNGREIRQLDARDPAHSNHLALSPDGQRLVVGNDGLWLMDAERGTRTRFTSDASSSFPLWSRDGNVLLYTSLRDGIRNLYQRSLAGDDEERFLATPGSKAAHDWSPDGRLLLYRDTDPKTRADLWVIPVEPAGQPAHLRVATDGRAAPVVQTPAQELNGQFSPDGQWIAYDSDESVGRQVYIVPFGRQGTKHQVSIDGGTQPRWRADGAELFFVSLNGQMMAAPIRRGADGSMAPGTPVALFPVSLRVSGLQTPYEYEVSRDGKQFLVNLVTESRSVISAIVNWQP